MRLRTLDLTKAALFVALAAISVQFTRVLPTLQILQAKVPLSFLPFISVMAGTLLGKRLGAIAMTAYMLVGLAGLPVFSDGGGVGSVLKPTFGFIIGFILAAYVSGWITEKSRKAAGFVLAAVTGLVPLYLSGIFYFWAIMNFYAQKAMPLGMVMTILAPFLIKDIVANLFAGLLAHQVVRRLPRRSGVPAP